MHNIQIKTLVYTNRIVEHIREEYKKTIDTGVIADIIKKFLADDDMLDAMVSTSWDAKGHGGVCAFTPEQLLELAPYGFNPYPIEGFVNGDRDLKSAIDDCFSQTFHDAYTLVFGEYTIVCREGGDSEGEELEELTYDLFHQTLVGTPDKEMSGRDVWLATNKDGVALCDLGKSDDKDHIDTTSGTGILKGGK